MRELSIFFVILVALSLALHPDFLSVPIDRVLALPSSGAYGIGAFHPLVFTIAVYLVFVLFRAVARAVKGIFIK